MHKDRDISIESIKIFEKPRHSLKEPHILGSKKSRNILGSRDSRNSVSAKELKTHFSNHSNSIKGKVHEDKKQFNKLLNSYKSYNIPTTKDQNGMIRSVSFANLK